MKVATLNALTQDSVKKVKQVRQELTEFFDKVSSVCCTDSIVYELMRHRGYQTQEMFDELKKTGVFKLDYLSELTVLGYDTSKLAEWGLLSEHGDYLLSGRYVVPIRDIGGNVIALVGWHPKGGPRKYVTTPTLGFSRDASFFNLDCYQMAWEKYNGLVYVVEGIFDTISLRSLGLPALGNMGLEMSTIKTQILSRFGKVIAIHDNDKAGRGVDPMLNAISGKKPSLVWAIENENVFVRLPDEVKDIDDFIKDFDCLEDLLSCQKAKYIKRLKIN